MSTAFDIGRVVVKTTGREAGRIGVIVDAPQGSFVTVDGQVKRRRCNLNHLEPTQHLLALKKNASHEDVVHELKKLAIEVTPHKPRQTPPPQQPKRVIEQRQPQDKSREKPVGLEKPEERKHPEMKSEPKHEMPSLKQPERAHDKSPKQDKGHKEDKKHSASSRKAGKK